MGNAAAGGSEAVVGVMVEVFEWLLMMRSDWRFSRGGTPCWLALEEVKKWFFVEFPFNYIGRQIVRSRKEV